MRTLLALLLAASSGASGVKGSLSVNGTETKVAYVYAIARPDPFDTKKEGVELLFAAQPVPEKDLFDVFPGEGTRLSAVVGADGTPRGVVILFEGRQLSTSRAGIAFDKKAMNSSRVGGRVYSQRELEIGSKNPLKVRFDLTFDAPVQREKKQR